MTRKKLVVQKYGGSSLSSTDQISNIAEKIISKTKQGYMVVVVVSAMGDSTAVSYTHLTQPTICSE